MSQRHVAQSVRNVLNVHKLMDRGMTYQLIYQATLYDFVWDITKEEIPDLLHSHESCCNVVFERIILPGNMCHECWNKNTMPFMSINPMRKIPILVFLAAVCQFEFSVSHESLG